MSKNKEDVFVYDVMAAILNNLHILKNAHGFTPGTQRIWKLFKNKIVWNNIKRFT